MHQKSVESQALLAAIVVSSDNSIVGVSPDGVVLSWNAAAERLYGYPASEMIGHSVQELVPAGVIFDVTKIVDAFKRGEHAVRSDTVRRRKDGTLIQVSLDVSPILDDGGALVGFASVSNGMGERNRLQNALKASDLRFQALVDEASDVIFILDASGTLIYVSAAAIQTGGYDPRELVGRKFIEFVHPDDAAKAIDTHATLLREPDSVIHQQVRFRHKDGRWKFVETASRNLLRNPGINGIVVNLRDVTDRLAMEAAVRDDDAMLATITRAANDAIYLVDHDGRIVLWNNGAASMYGYSKDEVIGEIFSMLIPPQERESVWVRFKPVRESGLSPLTETLREGSALTSSGAIVPIDTSLSPVRWRDQWHVLVISRSIADRKLAEAERKARTEAITEGLVETIQALAATVEVRDPWMEGHQRRVGELCVALAAALGLSRERTQGLRLAAAVHDIGTIGTPTEILNKPGGLSDAEFDTVKAHVQAGYEILKNVRTPWPFAEIVRQHHERLDGSGYPRGLKHDQILLEARILAVADVMESMTHPRPHRDALDTDAALAQIAAGSGKTFDAEVVDACIALFREQGFSFAT